MKGRIVLVFLFVLCLWGLLLARGAFLQVIPNAKLEKLKKKQFHSKVTLPGRRGAIFDRNGNELAISVTAYSLYADPKIIKNKRKIAKKISKLLKLPYRKVLKRIKKNRRFVWLRRRLDRETRDEIRTWKERGLGFIEEEKRVYPNGSLLAATLGFTSSDGRGIEGLERHYDKHLKGEDQIIMVRRDARGRPIMMDLQMFNQNRDGKDLYLTIDRDLQFQLEKEIARTIRKHQADKAVGVILDAKTSEVLAMANAPTFNPNRAFKTHARFRRNYAIVDAFEPGSTMKTILMASALKNKTIKPGKKYFCENGKFYVDRRRINEADRKHWFGWLTATEILAHSSNIGTSKIALELGAKPYHETLKTFNFGRKTGIDFPGESKGILNKLPWRNHMLANVSFGHGVATTPLQMAASYAAIANKGVWRTPSFTELVDVEEKRVMSENLASQLVFMLNSVTGTAGTVTNAKIPGFPVAGKTGTAQKVRTDGRGYVKGAYVSSFAGFVPVHDPKYVIYIAVDNPKKSYYGSQVAAPVFSKVASFAVRRAGLTPVLISEKNLMREDPKDAQEQALSKLKRASKAKSQSRLNLVPNLKGLTLREVMQQAQKNGFKIKYSGSGVVTQTNPMKGYPLPTDGKEVEVILKMAK